MYMTLKNLEQYARNYQLLLECGTGKLWIFEEYFSHPVIYEKFDADFIINIFIV